ncbi:MAG TPA: AMP-binding protein, partial [Hyphomicrobium sp.]|nr:AMP-binding protein [Hyphomicrobium sp.]
MLDLGRSFLAAEERSPQAVAIVDGDVRLGYAEWGGLIRSVAAGLRCLGARKGDHMILVLQNRWEMATLYWACQFLGVIVTPLNWRAKPEEIDYCIEDSGATLIAFQDVSMQAVAESTLAHRLFRVAVGAQAGGAHGFDELLQTPGLENPLDACADDWSLMLYTSGTTGKPKGVPRRHRHERSAALAHVAQNLYRRGERTLGVMPLYHTMGVRSLLSMALIDGCFVCVPKFDPASVLRAIEAERITNLYLVPTLYHDVV